MRAGSSASHGVSEFMNSTQLEEFGWHWDSEDGTPL